VGNAIPRLPRVAVSARTGEEPAMIPLLIAFAVACWAFWRVAWKILAFAAIVMFVSGLVMVVQDLHHVIR
jgi:hypothetical protein